VEQAAEAMAGSTRASTPRPAAKAAKSGNGKAGDGKAAAAVDPMQWWGALTQQFTQLAMQAMKEGTADAAKNFAGAVARQSLDAAGRTLKKAAAVPVAMAQSAVRAAAPAPAARRKRKAR
jgi:hypothetical protein